MTGGKLFGSFMHLRDQQSWSPSAVYVRSLLRLVGCGFDTQLDHIKDCQYGGRYQARLGAQCSQLRCGGLDHPVTTSVDDGSKVEDLS